MWRALDPILWNFTQNPWVVLQTVSRDQLEHVLADPAFRKNVARNRPVRYNYPNSAISL
jgi:starch phosphorylase